MWLCFFLGSFLFNYFKNEDGAGGLQLTGVFYMDSKWCHRFVEEGKLFKTRLKQVVIKQKNQKEAIWWTRFPSNLNCHISANLLAETKETKNRVENSIKNMLSHPSLWWFPPFLEQQRGYSRSLKQKATVGKLQVKQMKN